MDITAFLNLMREKKGESLTFKVGSPPLLRLAGQDKAVGKNTLDANVLKQLALHLATDEQKQQLVQNNSVTGTHQTDDGHRFDFKIAVESDGLSLVVKPAIDLRAATRHEEISEDEEGFLNLGLSESKTDDDNLIKPIQEDKVYEVLGQAPEGVLDIIPYLAKMLELEASDLFLTVDSPVKAKISGVAVALDRYLLTPEMTESAVRAIMNEEQIEEFERTKDLDFAIAMPDGSARFRANAFQQRKTVGLVMRLIPSKIPTADDLGLPDILLELIMAKRGLLLMVGGTGSGKSTTLAAMINHRNMNAAGHILTIEDPVEFSHPNLKSIVNQREVGVDTASYARALKACLREAPDVILIGEIRDEETMEAALELANTGHLCISTLHANNANQAMERIINMFPISRHKQLFMDLSVNLKGVISQRLIPDARGKRCAAIEIMINTPHIANLILKGELNEIKGAMKSSGTKGMKTFDDALYDLYKTKTISMEEALKNADSRNDLEARFNFG